MVSYKIPLRKNDLSLNGIPFAEFQSGEVVSPTYGGTGFSSVADFTSDLLNNLAFQGASGIVVTAPTSSTVLITAVYASAIWNASAFDGIDISGVPTVGQTYVFDGTRFITSTIVATGGSGETNTGSNLGNAPGSSFSQKVGADLQFRTISGINILVSTVNASTLLVSAQTSGALTTAITSLNSQTGAAQTINVVSGLGLSQGTNTLTLGANYTSAIWNASALSGHPLSLAGISADDVLGFDGTNIVPVTNIQTINGEVGPGISIIGTSGIDIQTAATNIFSISARYTSAIWNASALNGVQISGTPQTNNAIIYDGSKYVPSNVTTIASAVVLSGEMFTYDSTRNKWLGDRQELVASVRAAISASGYFRADTVVTMTSALGWYIPENATITGMSFCRAGTNAGIIQLQDDGVSLATLDTAGATTGSTVTLNANIDAGSILSVFWDSALGLSDTLVRIYLRKRL